MIKIYDHVGLYGLERRAEFGGEEESTSASESASRWDGGRKEGEGEGEESVVGVDHDVSFREGVSWGRKVRVPFIAREVMC